MKAVHWTLPIFGLWFVAELPAQDDVANEKVALRGSWIAIPMKGSSAEKIPYRFNFAANGPNRIELKAGAKGIFGNYTTDPAKTPKQIDFTFDGKPSKGIYEFTDAGEMRLCYGAKRPGQFKAAAGVNLFLLKRDTLMPLGSVGSIAFSPDGKTLASCGGLDAGIVLWDMSRRTQLAATLKHSATKLAISMDGKFLASSDFDTIKIWDVSSGKETATLQGHKGQIHAIAFSPQEHVLASASQDRIIKLWNAATGKPIASLQGHEKAVLCVAFSPDGKTLASGSFDRTIRLWDAPSGKNTFTLDPIDVAFSVAFSPDGKTLAAGGRSTIIPLWDASTAKRSGKIETHTIDEVNSIAFSPDGKFLAAGLKNKRVLMWELAKQDQPMKPNEIVNWVGHAGDVRCVAFSPDSRMLASGGADGWIKLWELVGGKTKK